MPKRKRNRTVEPIKIHTVNQRLQYQALKQEIDDCIQTLESLENRNSKSKRSFFRRDRSSNILKQKNLVKTLKKQLEEENFEPIKSYLYDQGLGTSKKNYHKLQGDAKVVHEKAYNFAIQLWGYTPDPNQEALPMEQRVLNGLSTPVHYYEQGGSPKFFNSSEGQYLDYTENEHMQNGETYYVFEGDGYPKGLEALYADYEANPPGFSNS